MGTDTAEDLAETSINTPIPIGRNGEAIPLRQQSTLITGSVGSGIVNMIDLITMQVARTRDAVIWHNIPSMSAVSIPWVVPWATQSSNSEIKAPTLDWAAHNSDEGDLQLDAALEVVKARWELQGKNAAKIPANVPAVVIIADMNDASQSRINKIDKLVTFGRSARVHVVGVTYKRNLYTPGAISTKLWDEATTKITLGRSDASYLQWFFCSDEPMDEASGPGAGYYSIEWGKAHAFQAPLVTPSMVDAASVATASRRPELDQASVEAAERACGRRSSSYTMRWARSLGGLIGFEHVSREVAKQIADLVF